ncbi:MAG: MIP/aquaporin family protein [Bacteroidota bacterium]
MSVFISEFIGTFFLIVLGNGVVANVVLKDTKFGGQDAWIVITTAWAFAVYIGVVIAGPTSGAHLNPAVTVALAAADKLAWNMVYIYIAAQVLGAMLGALTVYVFYYQHYKITDDIAGKRATFCTSPAIKDYKHNFFSEFVGTFVLVFAIFYITGANFEWQNTEIPIGLGSIGALPVAILVWVIGLSLGGTTGYAINPARDFGPRTIHALIFKKDTEWDYAWVPIIAPILGGVFAAVVHQLIS